MARKSRDYAAEQRRRNELARERGFTSRGQQRRAIETGRAKAIAPNRVKSPRTIQAQKLHGTAAQPVVKYTKTMSAAGFDSAAEWQHHRYACIDWSAAHATQAPVKYEPAAYADQANLYEYTWCYYHAFVWGPERYREVRMAGGSPAMKRYFTEITRFYTVEQYYDRY